MNWKIKALMMKVLSSVPFGAQIHYLIQRYVVRSLPSSPAKIQEYIGYAHAHVLALHRHSLVRIWEAQCYEFGVGRDFVVPFALAQEGAGFQTVVDIKALAKADLMNGILEGLHWVPMPGSSPGDIAYSRGIRYRAPCDARATGLPSESFDLITSTNVLEHVPAVDIPAILSECHRILRCGGVMSFRIDYDDHYSRADQSIPSWNFDRYTERQWRRYNSALHYQNRLWHEDYTGMFRQAGFVIVEERTRKGFTHNAQIVMTKGEYHAAV